MNIRLYGENDTRPQGSYENIREIAIWQSGIVSFITTSGKTITTSLRYKLTIEEKNVRYNYDYFEKPGITIIKDKFYETGEQKAKVSKKRKVIENKEDNSVDSNGQAKLL